MNPDSITKLTAGLFDGIKNMKSVKNYSYDKSNDLSSKSLMDKKYDNLNKVKMDKSIPIVSDEDSPLYKYPKKEIKEYQDEMEKEYDDAVESVEDEEMEKSKYDLKREIKNPLQDFYNAIIEEQALKRLSPKKQDKIRNRKNKVLGESFNEEFNKFVNKIEKKYPSWSKSFEVFNYIVKSGNKYKVAASKKELDRSTHQTRDKLVYLDKLVKKSNFTEQVAKKFIEKYNMTPKLITSKEINELVKPFYEKCLIKAFEKKIRLSRDI